MIKKIKRPLSILLVFLMVVSVFAIVPLTVSAAENDFYVVGTMTDPAWGINEAYKLTLNDGAEGTEYMITGLVFDKDTQIKVGQENSAGKVGAWYPDGTDNHFVIPEDGTYTVYFRPDGNVNWDSSGSHYFYLEKTGEYPYAAKINETPYKTFEEAVAARTASTDVITLLAKYSGTYKMTVGDTLIVDKNGYTFNKPAVDGAYVVNSANTGTVYTFTTDTAGVEYTNKSGVVTYYDTIPGALSNGTYKLLKNVTRTLRTAPGIFTDDVTIDLNGYTWTTTTTSDPAIILNRTGTESSARKFALVDNSTNKGGKLVYNATAPTSSSAAINLGNAYNNVTIGEGVTVDGCIAILGKNQQVTVNGTINGGDDFAIATNGAKTENATVIINEGAKLTSNDVAMYLPGKGGVTTINGGTIEGATAVYIKSGKLEVKGGTINGTGEAKAYSYNGNGCNATGDAIVVDSCGYPGGAPTVTISGTPTITSENGKQVGDYVYKEKTETPATVTSASDSLTLTPGFEWVEDTENPGTYVATPENIVATFGTIYTPKVNGTVVISVNMSKDGVKLTKAECTAQKDIWTASFGDNTIAEVTKVTPITGAVKYTIKGLMAGTTTFTVSQNSDPTNEITTDITVINQVSITTTPSTPRIVENGAVEITAVKFNTVEANVNDFTYTSGDETIATIDGTTITPVKSGLVAVTVTSKTDPTLSASVNLQFVDAAAKIDDVYYDTVTNAMKAAVEGDTVKLVRDVTESINYTNADIEMTLDLNGFTLTGNGTQEYALRVQKGVITVTDSSTEGTGAVTYGKEYAFIVDHVANNEVRSKLILDKGTFTGKTSVVQVGTTAGKGNSKKYFGGDLEVLGGRFITVPDTNETYDANGNFKYTLNKLDYSASSFPGGTFPDVAEPSTIVVKGGTFVKFDPSNNAAEGANTDFVDPDYKANFAQVGQNGEYTVVKKDVWTAEFTQETYTYPWMSSLSGNAVVTISKNGVALNTKDAYTEQLALWDVATTEGGVTLSTSATASGIKFTFKRTPVSTTTVTFSLKSDPTVKAEATIVITDNITGDFTLEKDPVVANGANKITGLRVNGAAADPADYEFSTENTDIATIDKDGNITPIKAGTVTVSVTNKGESAPFGTRNIVFTDEPVAQCGNLYYKSLQSALTNGSEEDTVILLKNITSTTTFSANKDMTLDLNGKTISISIAAPAITVLNGSLTVKDTVGGGKIANTKQYDFEVHSGGTVTIEGGAYEALTSVVQVGKVVSGTPTAGTAIITGGTFSATKDTKEDYDENGNLKFVLNKVDSTRDISTITVTGGSFKKFDPADNGSEGTHTNYVPEGYRSIFDGTDTYTVEKKSLFADHKLDLKADIGLRFIIDPSAVGITNVNKAVAKFSFDKGHYTSEYRLVEASTYGEGMYIAICNVPAAYMACPITAEVYFDDADEPAGIETISVQTVAENIIEKNDDAKLKTLIYEMLNYGAKAQTVFQSQMRTEPALPDTNIKEAGYTMAKVTADQIQTAIDNNRDNKGKTPHLSQAVAAKFGAKAYTTSLIYLEQNTLRIYFTKKDDKFNPNDYNGNKGEYYYKDIKGIAPYCLDQYQTFRIGGVKFYYSAFDYAKAVVNSGMNDNQKNLAKSLYLFNQAAKAYFTT